MGMERRLKLVYVYRIGHVEEEWDHERGVLEKDDVCI